MAVSEWRGDIRIETGTVHPEDVVALSRLACIATSDFPLGRSSEKSREFPPKNFLVTLIAYVLADISAFAFRTRFSLTIRIFPRHLI